MTKPSGRHDDAAPAKNPPPLNAEARLTLDALYTDPLPAVSWHAVLRLFEVLGTVETRTADTFAFRIGAEHHLLRKPHNDDLSAADIVELRHFVDRAGLKPTMPASHPNPEPRVQSPIPGILIAIDHHGAKVFQIDVSDSDAELHQIKPYDPNGYLHHLTHKDQSREEGQRSAEDPAFYEAIAQTVMTSAPGGETNIVVVGHGHGHSNAAEHFIEYLRTHHHETYGRTVTEVVADLSALTDPQLLAIGRQALLR